MSKVNLTKLNFVPKKYVSTQRLRLGRKKVYPKSKGSRMSM
jgi:hypothetical protein